MFNRKNWFKYSLDTDEFDMFADRTEHKRHFKDKGLWADDRRNYRTKYKDRGWKSHRDTQYKPIELPAEKKPHTHRKRKPVQRIRSYRYWRYYEAPESYFCQYSNIRVKSRTSAFTGMELQDLSYITNTFLPDAESLTIIVHLDYRPYQFEQVIKHIIKLSQNHTSRRNLVIYTVDAVYHADVQCPWCEKTFCQNGFHRRYYESGFYDNKLYW